MARGAMFAALVGAGAFIMIPAGPLFFSLQTMMVMLTGFCLGPGKAARAIFLYLAAGFIGLPVFGRGMAGPAAFFGPTCGFFPGFVAMAALTGLSSPVRARRRRIALMIATGTAGFLVMLACGAAGLRLVAVPDWERAFLVGMVPFLPVEPVKLALAIAVRETFFPPEGAGHA